MKTNKVTHHFTIPPIVSCIIITFSALFGTTGDQLGYQLFDNVGSWVTTIASIADVICWIFFALTCVGIAGLSMCWLFVDHLSTSTKNALLVKRPRINGKHCLIVFFATCLILSGMLLLGWSMIILTLLQHQCQVKLASKYTGH